MAGLYAHTIANDDVTNSMLSRKHNWGSIMQKQSRHNGGSSSWLYCRISVKKGSRLSLKLTLPAKATLWRSSRHRLEEQVVTADSELSRAEHSPPSHPPLPFIFPSILRFQTIYPFSPVSALFLHPFLLCSALLCPSICTPSHTVAAKESDVHQMYSGLFSTGSVVPAAAQRTERSWTHLRSHEDLMITIWTHGWRKEVRGDVLQQK